MNLSKKTFAAVVMLLVIFSLIIIVSLDIYVTMLFHRTSFTGLKKEVLAAGIILVITAASGTALVIYSMKQLNRFLEQIGLLTKRAMEIESMSDFTSRLPVKTNDEISQLAWTFNALIDRMDETKYSLEKNIEESSDMLERSIKERISALMSMNQVLTLMEEVFEHSLEGIIITDSNAIITKVNPAFTNITGFTEQEVIGKNPRILKSDHHNEHFYREMWQNITDQGHWAGEIWDRHRDGNAFPEWLSISAIRNTRGETSHYVGVFHDISDMKRQEELIRYQAFHDSLTGLPNRFLLKNRMEQSILHSNREKTSFGVLFVDLDNFRKINESLGHVFGDMLLKDAANRLRQIARNVDTVSRHGGDEFIILVESIENEKPLITLAQRIIMAFREPFKILDKSFHIGVSLGIAIYPQDGEDYDILLRNADTALYRAKEDGKETFALYTVSLNDTVARNLRLENDLRSALLAKSFEVYYQPQMDLKTGEITGVEGLARWNNMEGLMISPEDFIPFSEEAGLILEIDRIILEKSLIEIGGMIRSGRPIKLSLNCSAKVLHLKRLPDIITGHLARFNFKPEWLEIEITETSIMKNYAESIKVIHRLKDEGISIALDDFGTGYSSLSQLKNLPISKIKIDKSFVEEIVNKKSDAHIIEAVVSLSQKFGVKVVAEGVETDEQMEFLRNAGCDIVQGYYISRPLPYNKLRSFLGLD